MRLFLGMDGGGTGCRAVLADASGNVLARAEAGPANIASDPTGARGNLLQAARAALVRATGSDAGLGRLHVVMGLAGANVAASVAGLKEGLPFASLRVESDAVIAVKGALRQEDGIVAAIGTGSVFARQTGGAVRITGGRGLVLGDEGSGAWLGRALLARSLRALDGLAPMTPLLSRVLEEFGGESGVIAHSLSARPSDFAALAPRVTASADPAALSLLAQAEADIAAFVAALQQSPALPVVFLGGLGQSLAPRFAGRWPLRQPMGSALDGALWLALQEAA